MDLIHISTADARGRGEGGNIVFEFSEKKKEKKKKREKTESTGGDQANCICVPPPVLMSSCPHVFFLRESEGTPAACDNQTRADLPST